MHLVGMRKPDPAHAAKPVPVSIPTIVLDVHEDGTLTATLDGEPLNPPDGAPPWQRSSFPHIIDHASHDRAVPVRVEVREADGTVFTDLIAARPRHTPEPTPAPATKKHAARQAFHTLTGEGFVPGEDVAVAVITGHTDATGTGAVRALIDPARLIPDASGGPEVLLFGRISGTAIIRRVP
ncbi:hypothetical protein [Barrientosiimonas humi]|uniref:hypothetical protein n=1 Tax=Barrientosiimonas humi TaxID=999931 RepID=UPI00370CFFB4